MVWIDGLDVPFIQSLQVISFQPYRQGRLPVSESIDPGSFYGTTRPVGGTDAPNMPFLHYRWRDTYPSLQRLGRGNGNPYDGVALELYQPRHRRLDSSDVGLLDPDASSRRAYQSSPPHQHQHLSCLPRRRHNHDQRRAVSLGEGRHVYRAAVVLA